ncbi:DUF2158 domain-containing protein [Ancylobacter novellus]|uniref:YodC family protein n=1 Tax=Ancylobacter novellus TaxID=921 RepID=UPI0009D66906
MSEAEQTEEKPFNPGDVVQLKSGGAKMTVAWCEDYQGIISVFCHWFATACRRGKRMRISSPPLR